MPTPREILTALNDRIAALEDRVAQLEAGSEWDQDIDLDVPQPKVLDTARAPAFPWDPETLLMPGEDQETLDGAVVMARRDIMARAARGDTRVDVPVPESETIIIALPGGEGAEFPAPSPLAKAQWAKDAPMVMEHLPADHGLEAEDAADHYAKGGPLWLSAFDHEYLMGLPYTWRQAMVEQVMAYAQQDGEDLAKDILRTSKEASVAFAHDSLEADASQKKDADLGQPEQL